MPLSARRLHELGDTTKAKAKSIRVVQLLGVGADVIIDCPAAPNKNGTRASAVTPVRRRAVSIVTPTTAAATQLSSLRRLAAGIAVTKSSASRSMSWMSFSSND